MSVFVGPGVVPGPAGLGALNSVQRALGPASPDAIVGSRTTIDNNGQVAIEGEETAAQLLLQQPGDSTWIELAPTVNAATHPVMTIRADNVLLNAVEDQVLVFGHNAGPTGRINAALRGLWWQQEFNFNSTAIGPILSESFGQWTNDTGAVVLRPLSFVANWTTQLSTVGLQGDVVVQSSAGVQTGAWLENGTVRSFLATGGFHKVTNDTPILLGDSSAGLAREIIRISSLVDANTLTNPWFNCVNQNLAFEQNLMPKGLYIGLAGAHPAANSANLCVDSTTRGTLLQRQTTVQRDAIAAPAQGLEIQNTSMRHVKNVLSAAAGPAGADRWIPYQTACFGDISFDFETIAFAVGAGMTTITGWTDTGPLHDVTASLVAGSLTVLQTGVYHVYGQLTFVGEAADVYAMAFFVGAAQTRLAVGVQLGVVQQTMSFSGLLSLTANDVVTMRMQATGGGNIELVHGQLGLKKVSW